MLIFLSIGGIQKHHVFKPVDQKSLFIGRFASDLPLKQVIVRKQALVDDDVNDNVTDIAEKNNCLNLTVGDWVLVRYDDKLFPGEVKVVHQDETKVSVMVASGSQYRWPLVEDCIFYPLMNVIRKLSPPVIKSARGIFDFVEKW